MPEASQLSGLAAFTEGMSSGLQTGYQFAEQRRATKERDAKAEVAKILGQMSNYDPAAMEQDQVGFTGGLINPLQAQLYSGNGYKALEDQVTQAIAKVGDPDAMLAWNDKKLELRKANTLAAFDEAIAAAQFGNPEALKQSIAKASAFLFPGVTGTFEMSPDGTVGVIKSKNPDGSDAGGLAVELTPEKLMNMRVQLENSSLYAKMLQDAQQFDQKMMFDKQVHQELLQLKQQSLASDNAYRQGLLGIQSEQNDINRQQVEIQGQEAQRRMSQAETDKRLNEALIRQAELGNQKTQMEMGAVWPQMAKTMTDEVSTLFRGDSEEMEYSPATQVYGLSPQQLSAAELWASQMIRLNLGNEMTDLGTPQAYAQVAAQLVKSKAEGGWDAIFAATDTVDPGAGVGVIDTGVGQPVFIPYTPSMIEGYARWIEANQGAAPGGAIPE